MVRVCCIEKWIPSKRGFSSNRFQCSRQTPLNFDESGWGDEGLGLITRLGFMFGLIESCTDVWDTCKVVFVVFGLVSKVARFQKLKLRVTIMMGLLCRDLCIWA